ncbi:MAG: flagellar type III secretion system pore protein FliP [Nitrospinae bacterium]|nr:flagellar type III secretion system pore protein FliP [Nitrospinota bacterium]
MSRIENRESKVVLIVVVMALTLTLLTFKAYGKPLTIPPININVSDAENPGQMALTLQILLLLTILSLAPAILIMLTSFTRIVVVLSFLRQAMGTQQMPPNQVVIGLALFLTFFIMSPVWQEINKNAIQPYLSENISQKEALDNSIRPLRGFMLKQTREKDLAMFINIAKIDRPKGPSDIPIHILIPAFIISELKTAFQIGFLIYIPFLILDMVVASILLSMGMLMLPPILISLPFKLMLFVLVDGWSLIIGSLVKSFA